MALPAIPDPITIAVIGTGGAVVGTLLTVASTSRGARREQRLEALAALGAAAIELQTATAALDAAPDDRNAATTWRRCRSTFQIQVALAADVRVDTAARTWLIALEGHIGVDQPSARSVETAWRGLTEAIRVAAGRR